MTMKKNSTRWLIVVAAIMAGAFVSGCSSRGMTAAEVNRRHDRTVRNNLWQIQEDIDTVLLLDKPTRLSEQIVR